MSWSNWKAGAVIDLTLLVSEDLPCTWPGHMPYQQKTFNYFGTAGTDEAHLTSPCGPYQTRWLLIDEHTGTHVDAPAHFVPREGTGYDGEHRAGDITVDRIPLTQTMGPAAVVDVSRLVDPEETLAFSTYIEPEHLVSFESEHGQFASGDIVLFRSDWDETRYREGAVGRAYAHDAVILGRGPAWPAPSPAAMDYLVDRGVRCVGTDAPTMGSRQAGRDVHMTGLSRGCVLIEGLTNLRALPERGAMFVFAPLKIARGSGAPGRAFAVLP